MENAEPLDADDGRILRALQIDGRITYAVLAAQVSLSPSATLRRVKRHKRNPMDLFRAAVETWPEVVERAALTGEMDFMLRVIVQDMAHYSRFIMETLLKHPSVEDSKTSFVLERVKNTAAVPV